MPEKGEHEQRVKTYLSKTELARLDEVCDRLHQSRYGFIKTTLLNAIAFMEQWFNGELSPNPIWSISSINPLSSIEPKTLPEESEAEHQKRLHRQRMQALRLSNPAYAQAMDNKDHRAIGSELRKALKGIKRSEEQEKKGDE